MITTNIFIVLLAALFLFIIYTVSDNENRIYMNILTGIIAVALALYLGSSITGGNVQDALGGGTELTVIQDAALGIILNAVGVIMAAVVFAMVIEAAFLRRAAKREKRNEVFG